MEFELIRSVCSEKEWNRFLDVQKKVQDDIINNSLVDLKYGLVAFEEALFSIPRYKAVSEMISFPEKTVVVDCGCCLGVQQVFFSNCKQYIGIDICSYMEKICDNATFIRGDIAEVLDTLEFEDGLDYFGVSILCCSCFGGEILQKFKDKFDTLVSV